MREASVIELQREGALLVEDGNHGESRPRKNEFVDVGTAFIRAADMDKGAVLFEQSSKINAKALARITKGIGRPGDILISHKGTVGKVASVPFDAPPFVCSPQTTFWRSRDPDKIDRAFLYAFLRSPQFHAQLNAFGGETDMAPYVSLTSQRAIKLLLPDIEVQRTIGKALQPFDAKIDLNRQMNDNLEGMMQAIFRDWFVDFGPVRRKASGEADPVAIVGGLTPDPARAAHLAALFPPAFGNNGLPVGWGERPLDSIAEFLNGLALQKHPAKPGEPDLPVIKIAELRNGLSDRTNRAARTLPAKYIIKDGDFIFSWSGSLMAKVWTEGEGALNQHLFKVSSDAYPQWFYALWVHFHMPEFQLIAASKATTMGHIQRMHLTNATTVCPPDPTIAAMSLVMQPLWDRMIHNELENRTLAETRDYLLPRLMSGAVRVAPKAEVA